MAAVAQTPAVPADGSLCSPLPAINPAKGFTYNFNNPCYAVSMVSSSGLGSGGDANAAYSQMFYQVTPGYDLVVLGTFPNSRFMSATLYDSHLAIVGSILDYAMPPLSNAMINPFEPGAHYIPGQMFAFRVSFGGNLTSNPTPGCGTSGTYVNATLLDATQIHSGMTWLGAPNLPPGFPVHQTGANSGGMFEIRDYIGISNEAQPVVIVRQLSTGCAISASLATQLGIIAANQPVSTTSWLNQEQISAHRHYADSIVTTKCYPGMNPNATGVWVRSPDWVPRNNGATAYISAVPSAANINHLLSAQTFLRIQFPLPTTPPTPCLTGLCTRTGDEQVRYFSIEFDAGTTTIATLYDQQLNTDLFGNVTMIVGLGGARQPSATLNPAYTYFDLTRYVGYQQFSAVLIRDLLPSLNFECSSFNVPFYTTEWNPEGGFMGDYVPALDFPTEDQIPAIPSPPLRPNTCYAIPPVQPTGCAVRRNPV